MQTRTRSGIEVNLKDMFFHILYHWRSIFLIVLVCTVGAGLYQHYTIESIHARGEQTEEEKQYDLDFASYEASVATAEQAVRAYRNLLNARKEYRDGSLLLRLNPTDVHYAGREYQVKLDPGVRGSGSFGMMEDPADYLLRVYNGAFDEMKADDELMEIFGTDNLAYVREVARVEIIPESNSVSIYVYATNDEDAIRQRDYLCRYVEALKPRADALYPHTLEVVRENVITVTRPDLNTAVANISSEIESYQNALNNNMAAAARGGPRAPSPHIWRMAFFGFLFSAVFCLLLFGIQYAISGRVHESRDLTVRYQLPVYAEYVHSRAWNHHPGKFIDHLIENWEFRKMMRNNETVNDTLAALLKERLPSGKLLMTGSLPTEKMEHLYDALKTRMADGPELTVRGNLANDSETLTDAGRADAVIIVEEMHVSRVKDVDRVAELLSIGDAKAIGFVTI